MKDRMKTEIQKNNYLLSFSLFFIAITKNFSIENGNSENI